LIHDRTIDRTGARRDRLDAATPGRGVQRVLPDRLAAPALAQEGQQIRLLTSYIDDLGFSESVSTTPVAIPLAVLPTLAIAATDADQPEGNLGITPFSFTVSRSGDSSSTSSVQWAVGNTGINTAVARDFNGNRFPSGTVRFQPGQTSQTISVNVRADLEQEPDKSFTVSLSQPTGATISTATAVGTIRVAFEQKIPEMFVPLPVQTFADDVHFGAKRNTLQLRVPEHLRPVTQPLGRLSVVG